MDCREWPSVLLLSLIWGTCCVSGSTLIRGASPDNIEKYTPKDGKFTCFDGSLTIDFSQVNDNFCDCPDSSDEPGTSACPNGVFYCRNRGHEPKVLSTAFVDDGICDCCDGTDELSGCKNTCIEKNSAKRDSIKKQIEDYQAALDKKAQYVSSAHGVRTNIKTRFANVDKDIAAAEKELERLAAERKQVEEDTEVKRQEHKEEQTKLAAQRKAEAEARKKKAEEDAAAAAQKAADDAAAQAEAGAAGQEGEGTAPQEETDEERGRRIASQWTNDPAAAGAAVRAQQAQRQQLHAAQPQHAQSHPHHTVSAAHATSQDSQTSSSEAGGEPAQGRAQNGRHDSASAVQIRRDLASSGGGGGAADGGQRSAAAAAGVVAAQRAYVLVWAVLLVGCAALGGRRLVARCHR